MSVGKSSFTVFIPSLGVNQMLFLEEHKSWIAFQALEAPGEEGTSSIRLTRRGGCSDSSVNVGTWATFDITVFAKLAVTVYCSDKPPIDVKLRLERPWEV
jgi:hypothetical protein